MQLFASVFLAFTYLFLCTGAYDWAKKTLQDHAKDQRQYLYTKKELESAKTHDQLWNAAQVAKQQHYLLHVYQIVSLKPQGSEGLR